MPAALRFMQELGWGRVRQHNHAMATWAHAMLCERFGVEPVSPLDGRLLGATATVRLPGGLAAMDEGRAKVLQQSLYTNHAIEVPLFYWQDGWHLRVSCQAYNRAGEYERLAEVVVELARLGR
jgi:isopenicillin-N epimerase